MVHQKYTSIHRLHGYIHRSPMFAKCTGGFFSLPIGSMYGIFTYIYHKNQPFISPSGVHPLPQTPGNILGGQGFGSMKSRCLRFVVAWIQISQLPQNPRSQQKDSKLTTTHDAERLGSYRTFLTKDVLIKVGFQQNIFIMIGTR